MKIVGLETLWGGSPDHVDSARICIGFKKNILDSEIKRGS